jgi:hypothetical protein
MNFRQFLEQQMNLRQQVQQVTAALIDLYSAASADEKMMPKEQIPKAHDATTPYWSDPKFIMWLKSKGISHQLGVVPDFKDGGAGRAYMLDRHVVKFTGNAVEGNIAMMAAGNTKLPTPVIAVWPAGQFYAILEHKISMGEALNNQLLQAADYVTVLLDDHPGAIPPQEQQAELCQSTLEENGGDPNLVTPMLIVLSALSSLYQGTGFKHDDAGPTNIGVHQNRVVFPDLGPNQTADFSTDTAFAQINANRGNLGLPKWDFIRPAAQSVR